MFTQINLFTALSVVRGGCVSVEPLLKLCVYLDSWFNACVAIDRAINVAKGVRFDKNKSRRIARWIILILPVCVMGSLIHEFLYRELFVYNTEKIKIIENKIDKVRTDGIAIQSGILADVIDKNNTNETKSETYAWCMTRYPSSVEKYNTGILFFHLVAPFVINLASALFIIFGVARQRSVARNERTYQEHVIDQFKEHKQLVISPIILLILSLPRVVISLLAGCVEASQNAWLYLLGYFISFTPSILVFVVFVLPSDLYRKTFKESISTWCRRTRQ